VHNSLAGKHYLVKAKRRSDAGLGAAINSGERESYLGFRGEGVERERERPGAQRLRENRCPLCEHTPHMWSREAYSGVCCCGGVGFASHNHVFRIRVTQSDCVWQAAAGRQRCGRVVRVAAYGYVSVDSTRE